MGVKDVHVFNDRLPESLVESGAAEKTTLGYRECEMIEPGELHSVIQSGEPMLLVDLSTSRTIRLVISHRLGGVFVKDWKQLWFSVNRSDCLY